MLPGLTSKVSEVLVSLTNTLTAKADVIIVNSTATTTVLATLVPPFGGFGGCQFLINRSGADITTVTTGNILTARTIPVNVPVVLIFSQNLNKYVVGSTT
jgi:hypothetical protein